MPLDERRKLPATGLPLLRGSHRRRPGSGALRGLASNALLTCGEIAPSAGFNKATACRLLADLVVASVTQHPREESS